METTQYSHSFPMRWLLCNANMRNFTDLGRQQVYRLMKEREDDGMISQAGRGQSARWHLKQSLDKQ